MNHGVREALRKISKLRDSPHGSARARLTPWLGLRLWQKMQATETDCPLVEFRQQFMHGRDHLAHASFRELIENEGRRFIIGLSHLDSFSHYIWDRRFKFLFKPIEHSPNSAVPNWIATGLAVNSIAFNVVH